MICCTAERGFFTADGGEDGQVLTVAERIASLRIEGRIGGGESRDDGVGKYYRAVHRSPAFSLNAKPVCRIVSANSL
jgi:hypothetical protein